MPNRKFSKQIRPVPNRANGLWRGCIYALNAGWDKGPLTNAKTTRESIRLERGTIPGSIGATYGKTDFERGLTSGASADIMRWENISNRFDSNQFLTVAALVRPRTNSAADHAAVIAKRQNTSAGTAGWNLELRNTLTDPWAFEISNGVAEERAQSTIDGTMDRTDFLVGTFSDPANEIAIYVNGALNVSALAILSLSNTTTPISLFGYNDNGATGEILDSIVGMAGVWNRKLSASEIAILYADPYVMWRHEHKEFMFGPGKGGSAPVAAPGTFFLSF